MKALKRVTLRIMPLTVILAMALSACGGDATPTTGTTAGTAPTATTAASTGGTEATATTAASSGTEATATTASGGSTGGAAVTLSYLIDDSQNTKDTAAALVAAYTAKHPNVTIKVETRPGGTEGDNLVKTRLATGEMNDIFFYNSGSLLQALHPTDTLVDISKEPYI